MAEDNPVNQEVATEMLEGLGCRVDVVENGREAVEAVARTMYDLVFMDCQMPEMDGFAATGAIKASGQPHGTPLIIALTAHALQGDRQRCLAAGMDDYLGKPFTSAQVRAVLTRWLPPHPAPSSSTTRPR